MTKKLTITENLKGIMEERYYQPDENSPEQMVRRVADFIAEGERLYGWSDAEVSKLADEYYETIMDRKWIPSSPFLMNAGTKSPMLFACFVLGGLNDNMESIYDTLTRQAIVNKMGGGTGMSYSNLREEGAPINSTGGVSSGVMSFMDLFDKNGEVVKQGGRRRSANIGVLDVYHPEIEKFITYKSDPDKLNNFNISVLIDDDFMRKVEDGGQVELVSPLDGERVAVADARELFHMIAEGNWSNAEPGVLFKDNINRNNSMKNYLGDITTTNPCGEQPLFEEEACALASINYEEFINFNGNILYDELERVVKLATRFLDTAIDVNEYPDGRIEQKVKNLRRLGLGNMSLHGALIKAGYKYSSEEGREFARHLQSLVNRYSWEMSEILAGEKGVFPLWEYSAFKKPVRNVDCTNVAPTGTIQQILNTSSAGCEPAFAWTYKRKIGDEYKSVVNPFLEDFAKAKGFWREDLPELIENNGGVVDGIEEIPARYRELLETASQIHYEDHIRMQAALQEYVDNSISKTINLPRDATVEDIAEAYKLGWKLGVKGMTVYRDGSLEGQILSTNTDFTEHISHLPRGEVVSPPNEANGKTYRLNTGCGNIYLRIDTDEEGNVVQTFIDRGSKGTCVSNQEAVSRLISSSLRGGISLEHLIDQLKSVDTCASYVGKRKGGCNVSKGSSCPSAVGFALERFLNGNKMEVKTEVPESNSCPECGEKRSIKFEAGCITCNACGYSKCG